MIPPRDLAVQLAGSIFDHVERERTMVRHSIEDVICDGLMLEQAKAGSPMPMNGGAAAQQAQDAAKVLCKLYVSDSSLFRGMHPVVLQHIDILYTALLRTGWTP